MGRLPLRARDTVAMDTPTCAATSCMVTAEPLLVEPAEVSTSARYPIVTSSLAPSMSTLRYSVNLYQVRAATPGRRNEAFNVMVRSQCRSRCGGIHSGARGLQQRRRSLVLQYKRGIGRREVQHRHDPDQPDGSLLHADERRRNQGS